MGLLYFLKLCAITAFVATLLSGIIFVIRSADDDGVGGVHPMDLVGHRKEPKTGYDEKSRAVSGENSQVRHPTTSIESHDSDDGAAMKKPPQQITDTPTIPVALMKELQEVKSTHSQSVQIFYYSWYGTPTTNNSSYLHWSHHYLPPWDPADKHKYPEGRHKPPGDIASVFYPSLGPYSSADPATIENHMKWMASAGIDVVVVSWFPKGLADPEGESWDWLIPRLLDAAAKVKLKLAFHLEPYKSRTPLSVREDIRYILSNYGNHSAFYRTSMAKRKAAQAMDGSSRELPLFYIYDSYRTSAEDWATLSTINGSETIRGTDLDSLLLGLYVKKEDLQSVIISGFDGLYTYFAAEGFSHGSTMANWPALSAFCARNQLLFVPSVGPGYNDTRVRPWNGQLSKERRDGDYYRERFKMAHASKPDIVSITSFNEWHEGTQIEPAIPFTDDAKNGTGFVYQHYSKVANPEQYLEITLEMVKTYFTPHHQNIPAQIARIV